MNDPNLKVTGCLSKAEEFPAQTTVGPLDGKVAKRTVPTAAARKP
jgi:hypothetical protein